MFEDGLNAGAMNFLRPTMATQTRRIIQNSGYNNDLRLFNLDKGAE